MVVRVIIGVIMMVAGCAGIVVNFKEEGLGCLGAVASLISCVAIMVTMQVIPIAQLKTFWGMDYVTLMTVSGCLILFCIIFAESRLAGIIGCFVLFFTGLLMTGLLDAATVSSLSESVGNAGLIVFSPILVPLALVLILIVIM